MNEEIVHNGINAAVITPVRISYMEGYPLYPFFKRIYDEYVSEMNDGADYLVKSGIPAEKISINQE
jgi:hypothetical protein